MTDEALTPSIVLEEGTLSGRLNRMTGKLTLRGPGGTVRAKALVEGISVTIEDGSFLIHHVLRNKTRRRLKVGPINVLEIPLKRGFQLGGDPQGYRQFVNSRSWRSLTGSRLLIAGGEPDIYDLDHPASTGEAPDGIDSWTVTSVWSPETRQAVTMSFGQPQEVSGAFVTAGKKLCARVLLEGYTMAPGQCVELPPLRIDLTRPPREALEEAAAQGPVRKAITDPRSACNWNTFDYYFMSMDLDDILENADFIAKTPWLRKHVKAIVVDGGWEHAWGEWAAAEHRFPGGLKRLASEIADRGLVPGIWTAPFLAKPLRSRLAAWRGDLMARDEKGNMASFSSHSVLDPTHPEVREITEKLFRDLSDAGFRLFKVDYLDGVLEGRRFHDPRATPAAALRRGMEAIRRGVGPDAIILGCSGPHEAMTGLVDLNRVGDDIHNMWSHVQVCGRTVAWRWWMNGRWWWNDPDMLVVRGPETSDHRTLVSWDRTPYKFGGFLTGEEFSADEARFWTTLCVMSGGVITLSDRLKHLNTRGLDILRTALSMMCPNAARPVDYWCNSAPAIWVQEADDREIRLAVLNWYDRSTSFVVDLDEAGLTGSGDSVFTDVWSGQKFTPVKRKIRLRLKKHTPALLVTKVHA